MYHIEPKRRTEMGIHVGSASIVMIFAVLCLTVFATLSFQTASYEQKMAQKTADAAEAYYRADGAAEEIYQKIYLSLKHGVDYAQLVKANETVNLNVVQQKDEILFSYAVPIDDTQELQVLLSFEENGVLRTEQWNVVTTAQWELDDTIHVWDGDAFDKI